jgi:hypothetical protein
LLAAKDASRYRAFFARPLPKSTAVTPVRPFAESLVQKKKFMTQAQWRLLKRQK